jgi:mRNA-degrading endonuclease toxin of MazEF toxin-antitoxin module
MALLNQIRTIDCRRLVKRLGMLKPAAIAAVNRAIQISLGSSCFFDTGRRLTCVPGS